MKFDGEIAFDKFSKQMQTKENFHRLRRMEWVLLE